MRSVSRRIGRVLTLTVAAIGVVLLPLATVALVGSPSSTAAPATGVSIPGSTSLQTIGNCIRTNHRAAVAFLVDESGSLTTTDPQNFRVAAIQAALSGLSELTDGEAGNTVDVQMTGFSVGAQTRQGWTPLNSGSLAGLQLAAAGFTGRNQGFETDYYSGLTAAKAALDQQAIAMNPTGATPVCKMLFWFTDGKMEIDNRSTQSEVDQYGATVPWAPDIPLNGSSSINTAATDRGRQLLCNPGGVVDQMRSDGVFSAIVPLQVEIAPEDLAFLGALAQGQSGDQTCGTPGPAAEGSGVLTSASDVGQLILGFYSASVLSPPIPPGWDATTGVCLPSAGTCPSGTRSFKLDPTLSNFSLLAEPQDVNLQVEITGPDGTSVPLARGVPGTATASGAILTWTWFTPTVLLLKGSLPAGSTAWVGTWSVTFIDPTGQNSSAVNHVAIYLFGNLVAAVPAGTQARKGRASRIPIEVLAGAGSPQTDPALLKDLTITASVSTPGTPPQTLTVLPPATVGGQYSVVWTPAAASTASAATIQTSLTINTSDDVSLPAVTSSYSVPLLNPIGFPSFTLGSHGVVFLSPIRTAGQAATGRFVIRGGPGSTGCLWLAGEAVTSKPQQAQSVTYAVAPGSSQRNCLRLSPSMNQPVAVTASVRGYGSGVVDGRLTILMRNNIDGSMRTERVPVEFMMNVPLSLDTGTALWLLLLGVLGPLLVLYLISWLTSKFLAFDQLRYLTTSVRAARLGERFTLVEPPDVSAADAVILNRPPSLRSFSIGSFAFRVRMPWSPMGAAEGRVSAAGQLVVTNFGLHGSGSEGFVTRGLGSVWVASVAADALAVALRGDQVGQLPFDVPVLLVFNGEGSPTSQLEDMASNVADRLPGLLDALAAKLPKVAQPAADASPTEATPAGGFGAAPAEGPAGVYLGGYDIDGDSAATVGPVNPVGSGLPVSGPPTPSPDPTAPDPTLPTAAPTASPAEPPSDVYLGGYDIDGNDDPNS